MGFCKALKERQPDYFKIEVNLLIITFKKFLHFIISSNILSLKSRADLYTDFCLFVCYPPSKEIVHIQERSFIIILIGSGTSMYLFGRPKQSNWKHIKNQ